MNNYSARQYAGDNNRLTWAVYCTKTHVWYFPKQRGEKGAMALADRLNKEIKP